MWEIITPSGRQTWLGELEIPEFSNNLREARTEIGRLDTSDLMPYSSILFNLVITMFIKNIR